MSRKLSSSVHMLNRLCHKTVFAPLIYRRLQQFPNPKYFNNFRLISTMSPGHDHTTTNTNLLKSRPLSPHVSIYQPQLTWIMSIGHRVTGAGLAGAIYAFGMTAASGVNVTAEICEAIKLVPLPLVLAGKFVLAAPFMYHLLNGIRHLIWDAGRALTLRGVYATGWIVNISTLISAGLLTIL